MGRGSVLFALFLASCSSSPSPQTTGWISNFIPSGHFPRSGAVHRPCRVGLRMVTERADDLEERGGLMMVGEGRAAVRVTNPMRINDGHGHHSADLVRGGTSSMGVPWTDYLQKPSVARVILDVAQTRTSRVEAKLSKWREKSRSKMVSFQTDNPLAEDLLAITSAMRWERVVAAELDVELKLRMWRGHKRAARHDMGWSPQDSIFQLELDQQNQRLAASQQASSFSSQPPPSPPQAPQAPSLAARYTSRVAPRGQVVPTLRQKGAIGNNLSRAGTATMKPPQYSNQAALERHTKALGRSSSAQGMSAVAEGKRALSSMAREGAEPDVVFFNALMSLATAKGTSSRTAWQAATAIIRLMQEHGVAPDAATFNTLIAAASRSGEGAGGSVYRCYSMLEMMRRSGLLPTLITYSTLIHSCSYAMHQRTLPAPSIRGGRSAATSLCMEAREAGALLDLAMGYFTEMLSAGIEPNVVTCTSLLQVCAGAAMHGAPHAIEAFGRVRGIMAKRGIQPTAYTVNAVLTTCLDSSESVGQGLEGELEGLVLELLAEGGADVVTLNLLLKRASRAFGRSSVEGREGVWMVSVRTLRRAERWGVRPDTTSYTTMLQMLPSSSPEACVGRARAVLRDMGDAGIKTNLMSATVLASALLRASRSSSTLSSGSITPLAIAPGLGGAREGVLEGAMAAEAMDALWMKPDQASHASLLTAELRLGGAGACSRARSVVQRMLREGHAVSRPSLIALVSAAETVEEGFAAVRLAVDASPSEPWRSHLYTAMMRSICGRWRASMGEGGGMLGWLREVGAVLRRMTAEGYTPEESVYFVLLETAVVAGGANGLLGAEAVYGAMPVRMRDGRARELLHIAREGARE